MSNEAAIIRKYSVQIFRPEGAPTGITVFLPGTIQKLNEYASTYNVIVEQNQIVIGFEKMIPFPIIGRSHERMAEDVASVVNELRSIDEFSTLPAKYNIVGHSLGGKVALMVAARYDVENVNKIIALDPVDAKPQELTAPRNNPTTDLNNSQAEGIHLFQSERGGDGLFPQAPRNNNATVIYNLYRDKIVDLEIDAGAVHMSYKDNYGDAASVETRERVHNKIRSVIN